MKTLRIFWKNFSLDESNNTLSYMDAQCTSWEVTSTLLVLYKPGKCTFIPLSNVKSFYEQD